MTNNTDSAQSNEESDWITPKAAAIILGVTPRTIYSYVEFNRIKSTGEKRSLRVSRAEIERLASDRSAERVVAEVVGDASSNEIKTVVTTQIIRLEEERSLLQNNLFQALEGRRADAETIGELKGSLRAVEGELGRLRSDLSQLRKFNIWVAVGAALLIA